MFVLELESSTVNLFANVSYSSLIKAPIVSSFHRLIFTIDLKLYFLFLFKAFNGLAPTNFLKFGRCLHLPATVVSSLKADPKFLSQFFHQMGLVGRRPDLGLFRSRLLMISADFSLRFLTISLNSFIVCVL